jgi:hypothetical protein
MLSLASNVAPTKTTASRTRSGHAASRSQLDTLAQPMLYWSTCERNRRKKTPPSGPGRSRQHTPKRFANGDFSKTLSSHDSHRSKTHEKLRIRSRHESLKAFAHGKITVRDLRRTKRSRFFEIASVLVRFDHVARLIVNTTHSIM